MAYTYATADTWLRENGKRMIECPLQPGQLKISKDACTKRYMVAQEEDLEEEIKRKNGLFAAALLKGLSLCRECPIGKHLGFLNQTNSLQKSVDTRRRMHRSFPRSEELTHVRG
jgi:hypothetical protein